MKQQLYRYTAPGAKQIAPVNAEAERATHLLIAGTTGSGKSNALCGMIDHLVSVTTAATLNLVLIDPKMVELNKYRALPHTIGYANTAEMTYRTLSALSVMMEERYREMMNAGQNQYQGRRIVVVIDELADLMISPYKKQIKLELQHLLQLGRAAKITIWAATQAPNRGIIPADLVLNFTDRLALRCISPIESRQIIGVKGAEELPKYGKGIYLSPDTGLHTVTVPLATQTETVLKYYREHPPVAI